MVQTRSPRVLAPLLTLPALLFAAASLGACSGGGSSGGIPFFTVQTTPFSVLPGTAMAVNGRYAAFMADEASTGSFMGDVTGDGNADDDVPVFLDMGTGMTQITNVAGRDVAVVRSQLYMVVDEAEGNVDWDGGGLTSIVLLHTSFNGTVTFVDTIDDEGAIQMIAVGNRLFYMSDGAPMMGETSLRYIAPMNGSPASLTDSFPVAHSEDTMTIPTLMPRILGVDEGLLFLALDEVDEVKVLNGDTFMDDEYVLALADTTIAMPSVRNVGLALDDESAPFRALNTGPCNWTVGFLVGEAAQDMGSLNDWSAGGTGGPSRGLMPANRSPECLSVSGDEDTLDEVLHWLDYGPWDADPMTSPPVNTGVAGKDRVVIVAGFVATISDEDDHDSCDLNANMNVGDEVARWASTTTPPQPETRADFLVALASSLPGNAHGFSDQDGRFVVAVDESAEDIPGLPTGEDVVGWHNPATSMVPWRFDHFGANDAGAGPVYIGAACMSSVAARDLSLIGIVESVIGTSVNATPGGDMDMLDAAPTLAVFDGIGDMDFPGIGRALAFMSGGDGGLVLERNMLFYRVNEAEDQFDWNNDTDMTDRILFRTPTTGGGPTAAMSELNDLPGDVIYTDGVSGALFLVKENFDLLDPDLNNDGDPNDRVLSWFRIG